MLSTVTFKGVPLPPSSNNQYRSFLQGGKIRHVSSQELKLFKQAMDFYFLQNVNLVKFSREAFGGYPLHFHVDFGFERSRIISKKGTFKRMDVSNRLKAIHDTFAGALLIDDSMFVEISAKKRAVASVSDEGAIVTIGLCDFIEDMEKVVFFSLSKV